MSDSGSVSALSLRYAEALIDYVISRYPGCRRPTNMDLDSYRRYADNAGPETLVDMSEELINEQARIELKVLKWREPVCPSYTFSPGLFRKDDDNNATYLANTVVVNVNNTPIGIELESEPLLRLICGNIKRSLCERIRLTSYFVSVLCEAVSRFRVPERVLGDLVGLLSCLVRQARLDEASSSDDNTSNSGAHSDEGSSIHIGPFTTRESINRKQTFCESQAENREVHVPLSHRRACYEAIRNIKTIESIDTDWLRVEAVIEALQPFLNSLLDHPEAVLTKPINDSDCLVKNND